MSEGTEVVVSTGAETVAPPPEIGASGDNGLGFNALLEPLAEAASAASPSEAKETPSVETKPDEAKPAEEAKTTEQKADAPAQKVDTPEAKPEAKAEPSVWDNPDNPHRQEAERLAKQLKDTRDYATQVNQQNQQLAREVQEVKATIKSLADGTYDPEAAARDEQAKAAKTGVDQVVVETKINTSLAVAERLVGKDLLNQLIFAPEAPWQKYKDIPAVKARVLDSDVPVMEAIAVVKEMQFFEKYGRDPEVFAAKLLAEKEAELTKSITEKLTKDFEKRITLRENQPGSLATARTATAPPSRPDGEAMPFGAAFNPGLSR